MPPSLFGIQTPEQVCKAIWEDCPNECDEFVRRVAAGLLRILLPAGGNADNITWWISNWPMIDPTTTMMSVSATAAVSYALRGDFVIAGATADEISNSIGPSGTHHRRTSHGHVAVVTGCDTNGNPMGYSKALGGIPHPGARLSVQFPSSLVNRLHYFAVMRGTNPNPSPYKL